MRYEEWSAFRPMLPNKTRGIRRVNDINPNLATWVRAIGRQIGLLRASAQPEAGVNPPRIGAEFIRGLDRQRARKRQIDRKIFRHPRRTPRGHPPMHAAENRLQAACEHATA